jgi:hypothetical protein
VRIKKNLISHLKLLVTETLLSNHPGIWWLEWAALYSHAVTQLPVHLHQLCTVRQYHIG